MRCRTGAGRERRKSFRSRWCRTGRGARGNVLAVPRGAVATEGGHRYVYVVKANELGVGKSRLEKREIKVGIADATSYEVMSGLQEGEMVALPGDTDLHDGMAVQVVNTNAA